MATTIVSFRVLVHHHPRRRGDIRKVDRQPSPLDEGESLGSSSCAAPHGEGQSLLVPDVCVSLCVPEHGRGAMAAFCSPPLWMQFRG